MLSSDFLNRNEVRSYQHFANTVFTCTRDIIEWLRTLPSKYFSSAKQNVQKQIESFFIKKNILRAHTSLFIIVLK